MQEAQRAMVSVLLRHILELGLISNATYLKAEDLADSTQFPRFFSRRDEEGEKE